MSGAPVSSPGPVDWGLGWARPGAENARLEWRALALAFAFALLVLAQGVTAPFQKDAEPQSAEWVVSVVRDGQWLMPRDYFGLLDRKPPLYYWLSAIATLASGATVDEARARIVSVVAGALLAVVILGWVGSKVGVADGWLSFLFILGTYGFASRATLALTDMLMTLLLFSGLLILYPLANGEAPGASSSRAAAGGVVLGFGILTKGPVVLVLAALSIAIFLLLERRNPLTVLRSSWPWIVAAVALAIAACWYAPWFAGGGRKVATIFEQENFGHFAPSALGGTGEASRPPWYMLARVIGGALPLIVLFPAAALALWARVRIQRRI
ncbi:MAG TPA: glycosyltransferase family 39 protein, partial [Candidatus Binataceae bacterium]|nr:glycosyltransferase family 39 protein [Candidatus Binataceae bacterium]